MKRRAWIAGGSVAAVAALVAGTALIVTMTGDAGPGEDGPPSDHTAVCGFEGGLVEKITADQPSDEEPFAPDYWTVGRPGDGGVWGISATSDSVVVEREGSDAETILERYTHNGRSNGATGFAHERGQERHSNGSPAIAPDGTIYTIDSYEGRRQVVHLGADGSEQGAFEVPTSEESTGHPLDLQGIHWVADLDGAPAVLVGEGEHTVHGFRESGDYLGVLPDMPERLLGPVAGSMIAGTTADGATGRLQVQDVSNGAAALQVPFGLDETEFAVAGTPGIERPRGVAPGPDGDGFLVASAHGIDWVDAHGVRQGFWMNGSGGMTLWEAGTLVEHDGHYWVHSFIEGEHRVLSLSSEEMRVMLMRPVSPKASLERTLAQLGIGIGPVTDVPFNHFNANDTPEVYVAAEDGWGLLDGENPALELHYTVTGDPTLAEPVVQEQRQAEIPFGGGRTPLELPESRPGVYEVSLWLTAPGDDDPQSGACLRYSISPDSAPLDLAALSEGADWGGPAPLRGVEISALLGTGSHRLQLDFGALVSEPTAEPSASDITWEHLPGAEEGDIEAAFSEVHEAAQTAAREDVELVVQLGMNGEAEQAAVEAGTWEGWSEEIVAAFAEYAPEVTHWSPWNEPNEIFGDGAQYAEEVEIPFALAAHRANPEAQVLAGNSLGFVFDWWRAVAATDICQHVDAIAVHPYTGWNRSWEEEGFATEGAGFDELRDALGPECAALPIWDTETGWTSDGALSLWSQGSNVARKLLWYGHDDVAGWTYFFSEGGWGENDLSWSLIQHQSYVKPGALAFATVSRVLDAAAPPEPVESPIPFSYAMRLAGDGETLAVWTDSMRLDAVARTDGDELTVTDQYGHERTLPVDDGQAAITVTGAPQFLSAPAGAAIEIDAVEEFGTDVLEGAEVRPSSTHEEADPQVVTSGTVNPHRPWRSGHIGGSVDESPYLEVVLGEPTTIDRIAVASGSIVCCETGLRDYTVSVQTADEEWTVVAEVEDQFWDRVAMLEFDPLEAVAVRIEVPWRTIRGVEMLSMNYTDLAGGNPPTFMGLQSESDYVVSIAAVSAWEPAD